MNIIPKKQLGGTLSSLFTTYNAIQTPYMNAPRSTRMSDTDKESLTIKNSSKDSAEKDDSKGKLTEKDLFNMIKDVNGLPNEMKIIVNNLKRLMSTSNLTGVDTGDLAMPAGHRCFQYRSTVESSHPLASEHEEPLAL